jgi:hypothetical protein
MHATLVDLCLDGADSPLSHHGETDSPGSAGAASG